MKIKYRISKDKRCKEINDFIQKEFPHLLKERKPDLILVSGGDGAILHAIQEYNHLKVPFFGYGTGNLNFLMNELDLDKLKKLILKIESDRVNLKTLESTKISVKIQKAKNNKKINVGQAVNEVVLGSKLMGYHSFLISSDDGSFNNFEIKGSGICVSTDMGSTGYNFNLGGAVLPLGSNMWSLIGIVCNRYLEDILTTSKIVVENTSKRPGLSVFLDGVRQKYTISSGDKIIIQKGDVVKLAFYDQKEFFKKRIDISSRYRKG